MEEYLKNIFDAGIEDLEKKCQIKKYPKFCEFMDSHCQRRTYYFQIRKCCDPICSFHDKIRGSSIKEPFPNPVPYIENNTQHYQEGVDKEENYLPSKLEDVSKWAHNIPFTSTVRMYKAKTFICINKNKKTLK